MGKVLKYVGWSFVAILVLVLGTIGILAITGAFNDDQIYLDSITFDASSLLENIDVNDTTMSNIEGTLVVNDNFTINTTFTPAEATAKTLNLKVLKGSEVISIPKTIVAGESIDVQIQKVKQVNTGYAFYYIVNNQLLNSDYSPVDTSLITYELYPDVSVIKINETYYKYIEYNVGGEVRIQATDSEGGATYAQFDFFVDSEIKGLNLDFSKVEGLDGDTLVFNENNMQFTLTTTPSNSINPSTGEVYTNLFNFKTISVTSSDEDVISITNDENLEQPTPSGDVNRFSRYTFKSLSAGSATIVAKTLPTYQMYKDWENAYDLFLGENKDTTNGPIVVSDFATKYAEYLKRSGEIIVNEDGTVTTEGTVLYNSLVNSSGRVVINNELDYTRLMDLLFITAEKTINVVNVEIDSFRISTDSLNLDLFDTLKYNGQSLTRDNLIKLLGIKITSTSSNVSEAALNTRIDALKMYSVKAYKTFDALEDITDEDKEYLFTTTRIVDGVPKQVMYYTPISSGGVTKYYTYTRNDLILGVTNPTEENGKVWTVRANKEQAQENDGTAIILELYDEVSGNYFYQVVTVKIKINQINEFDINTNLITDMSLSEINNHGKPNLIYVDLRFENIGKADSLITSFTPNASYKNIKLFVTKTSAMMDGVLKVRVKTKDGTLDGEPMTYEMPYNDTTLEVYEIDYKHDSSGRICIQALNTSIKYSLDANNNPASYTRNNIMLYVGVVRTNVNGYPVDADGNLVDEKFGKESGEGWEYKNQYDFIKVANETMQFNIYSYLQGVQFYTANETGSGDFVNRTTVDGVNKEPVKMVVGQRFELYVTNLTLDSSGAFTGNPSEQVNLNTAFFEFYENNLTGQNKSARFTTNNPAAEVQSAITMINGMLKIIVECKDSTSSVDVYIAMDEAGNNFLETCTANMQLTYAKVAKEEDSNNNAVYAYYTQGAEDNKVIKNGDTLIVKGFLEGSRLMWQTFDTQLNDGLGEFKFGGVEQNSLDFNVDLNIDASYESKTETITNDIKDNATYVWSSSNSNYVEVVDRVDGAGYDPVLNIYKGEPTGIDITISCTVYMYPQAVGSFETKYNGTYFTFRFVINITQSPIDIAGYSKYEDDSTFYWQENTGTTTSQKIVGGESFDILAKTTAKDSEVSPEVERNPIEATIDGLDIRDSLTFTITTFSSSDNPNNHAPIYFLTPEGEITYQIEAGSLEMVNGDFSLIVYAKDTLRNVNAGIIISTFHTGYESFTYYVTVTSNLTEEKSLPTGETYIKASRGIGDTVYMFGETGKTLNDYYAIKYEDGTNVPLTYEVVSNTSYGTIEGANFKPSKIAPVANQANPMVGVQIKYTITLPGVAGGETYIYDEISIQVVPYYNVITYNTTEFDIKSGDTAEIFTDNEYNADTEEFSGVKFFNVSSDFGTGEIDNLQDIIVIQVDDSEERLKTVLGNDGFNALRANGYYLTNGQIKTSEALTSDETIKIRIFFVETNGTLVEIGGDAENPLYLKVINTVEYETSYISTAPYEVNKNYDITYNSVTSAFDISYLDTIISVYNSENSASNKVSLTGGNGVDVFNKIIDTAILQKKSGENYSTYTGSSIVLNTVINNGFINNVYISYNNSVNEDEYYRIVFMSTNDVAYEFHFVLKPNITISTFYPIYDSYEVVESGTYLDMETNYIKQSNRVELAYNGVVLNARKVSNTSNSITLTVPKTNLVASGLISSIDAGIVALLPSNVTINVSGVNSMFSYQVVSGATNVDSGTMQGSEIIFNITEGTAGGNTTVQVTAFNGATTLYYFDVKNNPSRYSVGVVSGTQAQVYANNEFNLNDFITSCRLDNSTPDFTALRIIITDFNGTTLSVETSENVFSTLNIYDLINYNAVLKFKDVAEEKIVVFKMYTKTSIEGDSVVELRLTVKPNVIVSNHIDNPTIPAGLEITLANTSTSPLVITKGDADLTPITTGISYQLVDEHGVAYNYDGDVTISGSTITHVNTASDREEVYVLVTVELDGCAYSEVVRIVFVPNVKIKFDYLESGVTYKELMAAPITYSGDTLINTNSIELWDYATNSSSYPITITDFYGNSLAANSVVASKPTIKFENELSGNVIENVNANTGMMMYTATNLSNVLAKVKVVITWGSVSLSKSYNIHFQPYIASSGGVDITYAVKTGSNTNTNNGYLSIYGGSEVVVTNYNTNNAIAISPDTPVNALFMQGYSTTINNSATRVTNSVAINAYGPDYSPITSYVRFNLGATSLYEIVDDSGTVKIKFKAVSSETQVRIPYYLDLVTLNGGGAFAKADNNLCYKPNTNGEIIVMLYPVINFVNTTYNNESVAYEVIIRNTEANYANLYTLLNVTLLSNTSFNTADSANKVIISKDYVAELITVDVRENYAYKTGQTIVFNMYKDYGKSFTMEFTIQGIAEKVVTYIKYSSKATLNEADPVKTFTYSSETYYIINTTIYTQKLEDVGTYDGGVVTLRGSVVDPGSISNLTLSDGRTNVLGIFSSDAGIIDLSSLVRFEVTNYKVTIDGVLYYLDEQTGNTYVLHTVANEKYDVLFTIAGDLDVSANVVIQETVDFVVGATNTTVTFDGTEYYVVKKDGVTALYIDASADEEDLVSTITSSEFTATYSIDFDNNAVVFSKSYPITSETVQLNKGGLSYVPGSSGDNSTYTADNNLLDLIPFYGTDLVSGQKPYTFQVMASGTQSISISFILLPVETVWDIEYNGNSAFNVIEPATGVIGEVVLDATYQTASGSAQATGYYYNVSGGSGIVRLDSTENNKLYIDYSRFTSPINVNITVSAYFNGKQESNTWTVEIEPLRLFIANDVIANVDPQATDQKVTIEDGSDGLVERGTYDIATDEFAISLTNSSDSEYVTINGNEVEIRDDLYLLSSKDVLFTVEFKTYINDVLCSFTDTATLTLNKNTDITGLQDTFTADSSYTTESSGVKYTTMNPTAQYPDSIKAVNSSDHTEVYTDLVLTITNFNVVVSGSSHTNSDINAEIDSNGLIIISYGQVGGNYPTSIHATFVISVTIGSGAGAELIYTTTSINCIITA